MSRVGFQGSCFGGGSGDVRASAEVRDQDLRVRVLANVPMRQPPSPLVYPCDAVCMNY